ncbi:MAG: MarR family transcriptional regulator [Lacibacter sp.]
MSLEKDISQLRKFNSEHHKAIVNLIFTNNWVTEKLKEHLESKDLTLQQFNILRILRGSDAPLSTLQIRDRMLDKMSDTSRIVDRLVLKNLARKVVNKKDKRLVDVTITAKGKNLLSNLDKSQTMIDEIVQNLNNEEAKQLNSLLDKIRGSV